LLKTSCHCGDVAVEVARKPASITECNCSICRRYGARWAYYNAKSVKVTAAPGAIESYRRGDGLWFDHCRRCGCVALWRPMEPETDDDRLGVNMRLAEEPTALEGVRVNRFDGARTWRSAGTHKLENAEW
jgi:hypothetical protein